MKHVRIALASLTTAATLTAVTANSVLADGNAPAVMAPGLHSPKSRPGAVSARAGAREIPLDAPAVVVFSMEGLQLEFQGSQLTVYKNPAGCTSLPPGAHVVDNLTNQTVHLYVDPFCAVPAPPPFGILQPGYGAHVAPFGSFSVS